MIKRQKYHVIKQKEKLKENLQNIFPAASDPKERKKERKVFRIKWRIFYEQRCFIEYKSLAADI